MNQFSGCLSSYFFYSHEDCWNSLSNSAGFKSSIMPPSYLWLTAWSTHPRIYLILKDGDIEATILLALFDVFESNIHIPIFNERLFEVEM